MQRNVDDSLQRVSQMAINESGDQSSLVDLSLEQILMLKQAVLDNIIFKVKGNEKQKDKFMTFRVKHYFQNGK